VPLVPIRDLGTDGVNTDVDPYSSPVKLFSMATGCRFEDKKISRAPLFLNSGTLVTAASPQWATAFETTAGSWNYLIVTTLGNVVSWTSGGPGNASVESDISIAGYAPSSYTTPVTTAILSDVVYINRNDRVPWYMAKSGSQFAALPNAGGTGWDSTWRCQAIREAGGVLVAIGMQESGINYPTKVRSCDYMAFGVAAQTWAPASNNSATYNVLADCQEPLVDGWPMRDKLVLYCNHETWMMEPRYDQLMWNYRRIFNGWGVISQNCVAEVNNVHYVFGPTDIWTHDGFNMHSLAAGRVRDFVYNNMVSNKSNLFFVQNNPRCNELMFCYLSTDPYCAFPVGGTVGYPGCNRAVVYNYRAGTFYFYDLPYVTSGSIGVSYSGITYAGEGANTYASMGLSTYGSFGTLNIPAVMMVSPQVTFSSPFTGQSGTLAAAVRGFDRYGSQAVNGILDLLANAPVYIENEGVDLDDFNENLRTYKVVKSMYPECRLMANSKPMYFSWGSADYASSPPPQYGTPQSYDGNQFYKLDANISGRYLSLKITYADNYDFQLSGFDFDFENTGQR